MRVRTHWSGRARLLWLFALVVAFVLAWLDWRSNVREETGEPSPPPPGETVEFEVVGQ